MKILVTGANGFLGKGTVKQLLDDGYDVVATDFSDSYIDKRATIKCGNLFKIEDPYHYFEEPDILVHMAWRDGFIHNSLNHINDLSFHYNFIRTMINSGVKKIAVLGTMHEIGFYEGSINETTPTNPQSLYGISKDSLRKLVELECSENGIIFQWLRGFYIVGNEENGNSIFSKILKVSREGKKEFPFTTGINQYDFLDYELFCKYVADTVVQDNINGIINICSGQPEKLSDRVERFIKENHLDIELKYGVYPDRKYDSKAVWGNSEKIELIEKSARDKNV